MSQEEKNNNEESTVSHNDFIKESKVSNETGAVLEQPKKSSLKRTILTLLTLAVIGGIGFFVYISQVKLNEPSKRFEQKKIDYTQIIDNWNKQVQNNTSKKEFLLSRDSNDEMMEQLENWMKSFYIPEITDSSEYNQFLEENKFGKPTYFDTSMSKDKVRELLKKAVKEKVMSKIVKKVLRMNDMELWEKLEK